MRSNVERANSDRTAAPAIHCHLTGKPYRSGVVPQDRTISDSESSPSSVGSEWDRARVPIGCVGPGGRRKIARSREEKELEADIEIDVLLMERLGERLDAKQKRLKSLRAERRHAEQNRAFQTERAGLPRPCVPDSVADASDTPAKPFIFSAVPAQTVALLPPQPVRSSDGGASLSDMLMRGMAEPDALSDSEDFVQMARYYGLLGS